MRHSLVNFSVKVYDYIRGAIEVLFSEPPRYSFIIQKLDVAYSCHSMMTEITYTPLGCYRPLKKVVSDLNNSLVCRKFKPDHARIILGIHTLEKCLDLKNKEHVNIYLKFVGSCIDLISSEK